MKRIIEFEDEEYVGDSNDIKKHWCFCACGWKALKPMIIHIRHLILCGRCHRELICHDQNYKKQKEEIENDNKDLRTIQNNSSIATA